MVYHVGYHVALDSLKFDDTAGDEDTMVSEFQAMPYGEYQHPVYGKINFNQDVATQAAENVNNKVRGTDLDIDYDHKQYGGEAAGWVKHAEARTDGLYLTVEWTKKAAKLIKDKAYRYFSPEFSDEWEHPKTKVKHKNVLFGGGITNRPFLKDILPLNMSELFEEQTNQHQEGNGMDPKKLRKLLGLPEDATDAQVTEKMDALPPDFVVEVPAPVDDVDEDEPKGDQTQTIAAGEGGIEGVIKLAETSTDPVVKALVEVVGGLHKQVQTTTAALELSETDNLVRKLSEPVNGRALSAGAQAELKKALLARSPKALNDSLVTLVESLKKDGLVQLGELGEGPGHGDADGEAATKKFNDEVAKLTEGEKGMSYGDAVERVASEHPDLFEGHRQASYAFREQ